MALLEHLPPFPAADPIFGLRHASDLLMTIGGLHCGGILEASSADSGNQRLGSVPPRRTRLGEASLPSLLYSSGSTGGSALASTGWLPRWAEEPSVAPCFFDIDQMRLRH